LRAAFQSGFLLARLTINLDGPKGFSFYDDKIWGIHAGGGFSW
jgi:hypothetical protein